MVTELDPERFEDVEGNRCSLDELCRREPDWAASRLRFERRELALLRASLAAYRELTTAADDCITIADRSTVHFARYHAAREAVRKLETDEGPVPDPAQPPPDEG